MPDALKKKLIKTQQVFDKYLTSTCILVSKQTNKLRKENKIK